MPVQVLDQDGYAVPISRQMSTDLMYHLLRLKIIPAGRSSSILHLTTTGDSPDSLLADLRQIPSPFNSGFVIFIDSRGRPLNPSFQITSEVMNESHRLGQVPGPDVVSFMRVYYTPEDTWQQLRSRPDRAVGSREYIYGPRTRAVEKTPAGPQVDVRKEKDGDGCGAAGGKASGEVK